MTALAKVRGNLDPSLAHAWHPVALARELRPGGWLQARLLGRTWTLRRTADGLVADPPAWGVRERLGLVWLAPDEPADIPLEVPEAADRRFVAGWLAPARSHGPAGPLVDTFLDIGHGPFAQCGDDVRRRATCTYRPPFQLRLRLDFPDTGATTTILVLLQPEDADSTRVYSCLLLSAGAGRPLPSPAAVAAAVAAEERALVDLLVSRGRAAA